MILLYSTTKNIVSLCSITQYKQVYCIQFNSSILILFTKLYDHLTNKFNLFEINRLGLMETKNILKSFNYIFFRKIITLLFKFCFVIFLFIINAEVDISLGIVGSCLGRQSLGAANSVVLY